MVMFKALNKVKLSWNDTQEKESFFRKMGAYDFEQTVDSEKYMKGDTDVESTNTELSDEESESTDNTTINEPSSDDVCG